MSCSVRYPGMIVSISLSYSVARLLNLFSGLYSSFMAVSVNNLTWLAKGIKKSRPKVQMLKTPGKLLFLL